ncbi:MAG: ABC transporter substrate-binding protein [Burkholderiales bacterium]|nr:ABC transporter substrate-binding protein [Anaerolineae bacterium]
MKSSFTRTLCRVLVVASLCLMVLSGAVLAQDATDPCPISPAAEITWLSPRGTLEVMDDYPIWVAIDQGYFEELGITVIMEPGPLGGANLMSLITEGQADVGFPSPGVLTSAIDAGIPVMVGFGMSSAQVFDFALPADSDIETVADLEGKTIALGSMGWQPIVDPILAEAGVDLSTVTYVDGGNQWGQMLEAGQADAALAWEGLRAQWNAIGLDFKYLIGTEFSDDPANPYVIRADDLEDPAQVAALTCFFRGVAMGLEFGRLNPQAAAQITYSQFPALAEQMEPDLALESMRQLAFLYNQTNKDGDGYGYSDEANWQGYLDRVGELEQTSRTLTSEETVTNMFVESANAFDHDRVAADAEAYETAEEWAGLELLEPIE